MRRSTAVFVPPRHETSMLATATAGTGLSLRGTSSVSTRGGISLATTSSDAVELTSGARVSVAVLRTAGAIDDDSEMRLDGALEEGADIPQDPFASSPLPALDPSAAQEIPLNGSTATLVPPGVHSGLAASTGTIVLQPGLHQFVGAIVLDGSAALQLSSATVQLDHGASLVVSGSASLTGTPSASVPGWAGAAVIGRGGTPWAIEVGALVDVDGLVYAPEADVEISGSAMVRAGSTILRTLSLADLAMLTLDGEIDALETDPVPGRARLVR
jgi:hypothetical protein